MFEKTNAKMKEMKNEAKELLDENKKAIKVGTVCLLTGFAVGFFKGVNSTDKLYSKAFLELLEKLQDLELIEKLPENK